MNVCIVLFQMKKKKEHRGSFFFMFYNKKLRYILGWKRLDIEIGIDRL